MMFQGFTHGSVLILCLLAGFVAAAADGFAQGGPKPAPDAYPPHIRHYLDRQAAFRAENREMQNVVLLGDSITEGFDVKKFFPGHRVVNRGISSDTIGVSPDSADLRGVLKRLDTSVFDCCTSHVFLMIGINDLGDKRTPEEMLVGYRRILETIRDRAPGVTIHVESVLPTGDRFTHLNPGVTKFNAMIRALAGEMGCPYMDLGSLMADEKGELRSDLTREGLHINDKAYAIWKKEIDKAMGWAE